MNMVSQHRPWIARQHVGGLLAISALLAFALPAAAINPPSPELCVRDMQSKSMKYADCMNAADIAFRKQRDANKLMAAQAKCEEKYTTVWTDMASCDYTTTQQDLQDYLDAAVGGITQTLDGAPLPVDVATCNSGLDTCTTNLGTCTTDLGTCQQDLTACESLGSGSGGLPKTGQTTCWDTNNIVVACQNNGGDGEKQAGMARSYTDNGDGTITDNTTRLMWESLDGGPGVHSTFEHYTWHDAIATKIATLNSTNFAGHNDWRLPNVLELQALVDYGRSPAINAVFDTGCASACVAPACACSGSAVWSSTSDFQGPMNAQEVEFSDGETYNFPKTGSYNVRAVRSLP